MDAEDAFNIVGNLGRYQLFLSILFFLLNFDLYDQGWIVDFTQSILMLGFLIGSLIFGQISDTYGRQAPLLAGGFLASVSGFCSAFATTWETYSVARFFTGFFLGGSGVVAFVCLTEFLGKKVWATIGLIDQAFFSIGIMLLGLLGYLIPKWQTLCMVTGGLYIGNMILMIIFIPQSPRWLYSTGKTEKAEKLLKKMAKRNGKDGRGIRLREATPNLTTHTYIDLLRHKRLIYLTALICFLWFANGIIYYGLTLSAASLTSDLFLGIVLSGAIEIPANIMCIFLMDCKWIGRKGTLWILFGLCAACNIIGCFTYQYADAKLILGLGAKLAIAGGFNVIYVYTCEIFPTSLRTVAVGVTSLAARIGSIIAPFLAIDQSDGYTPNGFIPYLVFGAIAAICVFVLFFLPKTLGKPVPQTLEEVIEGDAYQPVKTEEQNPTTFSDEEGDDKLLQA